MYSDTKFGPNDDPALLINPSNPNYKTAADYLTKNGFAGLVGQPLSITSRVFDFGPRTNYNEVGTNRFVGGFKGSLGEHDWEAAAQTQKHVVARHELVARCGFAPTQGVGHPEALRSLHFCR
jgi:hypothetical protein